MNNDAFDKGLIWIAPGDATTDEIAFALFKAGYDPTIGGNLNPSDIFVDTREALKGWWMMQTFSITNVVGALGLAAWTPDTGTNRLFTQSTARSSKIIIQFGKTENQIYHAFRHTDKLGLDRNLVQSSIQSNFKSVSSQVVAGKPLIKL